MTEFNRIGLVGRPEHSGVITSLTRLIPYLQSKELVVVLDHDTASLIDDSTVEVATRMQLSASCDLVIVVGGDGSMLNVAKYVASEGVPVIGINRGKLGFLTDILPDEIEAQIDEVLAGNYSVEKRFLLDVMVNDGNERQQLGSALNDVVLHPGKAAQMIEFDWHVQTFVPSTALEFQVSQSCDVFSTMEPDLNLLLIDEE